MLSNCSGPGTELETYIIKEKLFNIFLKDISIISQRILIIQLQRAEMKIQRLNHLLQLLYSELINLALKLGFMSVT